MKKIIQLILLSIIPILLLTGCNSHSEITLEDIQKDIVGRTTNDKNWTLNWTFQKEEPRKITVIKGEYDGDNAIVIVNMQTSGYVGVYHHVYEGKLRLHYEWIAEEWNLVEIENLTFHRK